MELHATLRATQSALIYLLPQGILASGAFIVLIMGMIMRRKPRLQPLVVTGIVLLLASLITTLLQWPEASRALFHGAIVHGAYESFGTVLADAGCILALLIALHNQSLRASRHPAEFVALVMFTALGAHLLLMSTHFIMIVLSLEILSISAYVLTGFSRTRQSAEGSMKYFLFGSVATAVMIYGFSILYGLSGTLDFTSPAFADLIGNQSALVLVGGLLVMSGYLFKIAAGPMHLWAPDVYEAAPVPVVALFATVPKLAGIGALAKLVIALNLFGQANHDWQLIIAALALVSMIIGNFGALRQVNSLRMMAYSSIAQTGFLLAGIAAFSLAGIHFTLFYLTVYLVMNFLVFAMLQRFENESLKKIPDFSGIGKKRVIESVMITVGLVSLAGLPPTAGFTAKLLIFTGVWEAFQATGKSLLLILLMAGLLNTVVSLFYYLKIPYFAFLKAGSQELSPKKSLFLNFLSFLLVLAVLLLFGMPDLLMGWLNTINFGL